MGLWVSSDIEPAVKSEENEKKKSEIKEGNREK